ncbi:MAG: efflux RND transporter periplasmic adaptor subunit [Deltaproteobacteria bacterium]|nr:efflux RND transporter periplasmic adaptor subunit [Deltaproteobacteria bacterium]
MPATPFKRPSVFLALAGLLGSAWALNRPAARAAEPRPIERTHVRLVAPRLAADVSRVPATIQASERATISSRVAARVTKVNVHEGDAVQAGAVLARLADDDVRAQLRAAETGFDTASAQEKRMLFLKGEGAVTQVALDQARAQRAQAEAALGTAREALGYTELRAPFAGRIQAKHVNEGDLVTPGAPLLELEGAGLELVATLSADEVAHVARGQSLAFDVDGVRGQAEVTNIAPSADPVAHRVETRARVTQAPPNLRAGTFARLALPGSSGGSGVWVPRSALVQRGDLRGVFVAANGVAELRWLLLGDVSGGQVPVLAGLGSSEQIVDEPGALKDGQPIEVSHGS